jgi:YggT family protein
MSYLTIIALKLLHAVSALLTIYMWAVIINALLTWVSPDPYNPVIRILRSVTEPVYSRIRRWMPFVVMGGFDLSPVVVIIAVQIATALLDRLVFDLGMTMRGLGA